MEQLRIGVHAAEPRNFYNLRHAIIHQFQLIKANNPLDKIFFVSGAINADGEEHKIRNRALLLAYTDKLQETHDSSYYFTAATIVTPEIREMIGSYSLPRNGYEEFVQLWNSILTSGYVDGIIMTQGWRRSSGATVEHDIMKRCGLIIIDWDEHPELMPTLNPNWQAQYIEHASVSRRQVNANLS